MHIKETEERYIPQKIRTDNLEAQMNHTYSIGGKHKDHSLRQEKRTGIQLHIVCAFE